MQRTTKPPKGEVVDDSITLELILSVVEAETTINQLVRVEPTQPFFNGGLGDGLSRNTDWFKGDLLRTRENNYWERGVLKTTTLSLDSQFSSRLLHVYNQHMTKAGGKTLNSLPYDVICKVAYNLIDKLTKRSDNV